MKKYLVSWTEYHEAEIEAGSQDEAFALSADLDGQQTIGKVVDIKAQVISGYCNRCDYDFIGSFCDRCAPMDSLDEAKRSAE